MRGDGGEYLLVVRSRDKEIIRGITRKIQKMRDPVLKRLGILLEEEIDE